MTSSTSGKAIDMGSIDEEDYDEESNKKDKDNDQVTEEEEEEEEDIDEGNKNTSSSSSQGFHSGGLGIFSNLFGNQPTTSSRQDLSRLNELAAKNARDIRTNLLEPILVRNQVSTSSSGNVSIGNGYNVNYAEEMNRRKKRNESGSVSSTSNTLNNDESSDITSGISNVNVDVNKVNILNPQGMNSPANALKQEEFYINHELQSILMNDTPRVAGHCGKQPITIKTYVYITDGRRCWLVCCDEHLILVTSLIYAKISEKGMVSTTDRENGHWNEVYQGLIAEENTTDNVFHGIISPQLASILSSSPQNKQYVKKWGQMGSCLLQTIKKKVNSLDGR